MCVEGTTITFKENLKFLKVIYDRLLCFSEQVKKAAGKLVKGSQMCAALSCTAWGWHEDDLARVYRATSLSSALSAAAGWAPLLSASQVGKLDKAQARGLRRITGQLSSTPLECLVLETGFQSFSTVIQSLVAISFEKSARLPAENPRAALVRSGVAHRYQKRSSWCREAEGVVSRLGLMDLPR